MGKRLNENFIGKNLELLAEKHRSGSQQERVTPFQLTSHAQRTASLSQPWHTHRENTSQECCRNGQQPCTFTGKSLEKGYGEKLKSYTSNSISVTSFEVWNSKPRRFGTYRVHGRTACSSLANRPMGSRIKRRRCEWRMAQWKLAVLCNIITNGRSFH